MTVTVDDLVAEGERVVAFWTLKGTHQGEFWGVAPTGNSITGTSVSVFRLSDGLIAEYHLRATDRYGILRQLGAIPV
jgi:predicted ester cyclase